MLASKENARKALRHFESCYRDKESGATYSFVTDFLNAAIKRLPTEASFKRDRERRRAKAATK